VGFPDVDLEMSVEGLPFGVKDLEFRVEGLG